MSNRDSKRPKLEALHHASSSALTSSVRLASHQNDHTNVAVSDSDDDCIMIDLTKTPTGKPGPLLTIPPPPPPATLARKFTTKLLTGDYGGSSNGMSSSSNSHGLNSSSNGSTMSSSIPPTVTPADLSSADSTPSNTDDYEGCNINFDAGSVFQSNVESIKELLDTVPLESTEELIQRVRDEFAESGNNMSPAGLKCELMEHQVVGMKWMSKMEDEGKNGILGDEMGMGKTIMTIAVILQNQPNDDTAPGGTLIVCPQALLHQWQKEVVRKTKKLSCVIYHTQARHDLARDLEDYDVVITTYGILVQEKPADLNEEVEEAADDKSGTKRKKRLRKGGPLFRMKWHRVVLDEAQVIRNKITQQSIAVTQLKAKHKWCLTGTPLQTHLDELFSFFRFLETPKFQYYAHFSDHITKVEKGNPKLAMARLQTVLRGYMLRRRKNAINPDGTPILKLPSIKVETHVVDLTPTEKRFYNLIEKCTQDEFRAMLKAGVVMEQIAHILVMLLRLRLAATHPSLLKNIFYKTEGGIQESNEGSSTGDDEESESRKKARTKLLPGRADTLFQSIDNEILFEEECPICTEEIVEVQNGACVTLCGHVFCRDCIVGHLNMPRQMKRHDEDGSVAPCPICRNDVREEDLISLKSMIHGQSDELEGAFDKETLKELEEIFKNMGDTGGAYFASSKTAKMIEILLDARANAPNDKFIIFSQWTRMLDIVEKSLKLNDFKYCRYDGSMSTTKREKAVEQLQDDPDTTIMLVSLKAGGVGLNLTSANRIINLDIWYNPQLEQQAFGRVHRVGQTKNVQIHRFNVAGTVEERIQLLIHQRLKMAEGALGDGVIKIQRLTLQNLIMLFAAPQQQNFSFIDFEEDE